MQLRVNTYNVFRVSTIEFCTEEFVSNIISATAFATSSILLVNYPYVDHIKGIFLVLQTEFRKMEYGIKFGIDISVHQKLQNNVVAQLETNMYHWSEIPKKKHFFEYHRMDG